jgi:DNA-3-methyladenine glycosylase II
MQTRSRTGATALVQITKVLKTKKETAGRVRKTIKRTIVTTAKVTTTKEEPALQPGHLEEKSRLTTPPPNSDPTLAALTSPNTHRLIHIPHSELHATFLERASQHLISVDARFKELLEKNPCHIFSAKGLSEGVDPYKALVCGILSQQVSGAAARSITRKFILLFSEPDDEGNPPQGFFPTPNMVLTKTVDQLRPAGLSGRKAEYVVDLTARFADGRLNAEDMVNDTDETILEKLVEVRGIGVWSTTYFNFLTVGAEMFLMFALKRPDVLSTGDLGIQRGMAVWTGKNIANAKGKQGKWKYMAEKEMLEEGEKWRPYRSLGSWLMWRVEGPISAPVAP